MNREKIIGGFSIGINKLIVKFHSNPYYFFYEEDMKIFLYSQLTDRFEEEEFLVRNDFAKIFNTKKIKSIPIKSEYPLNRGTTSKYDLTYIEAVGDNHYELPSSVVIELKLGSGIYDRCGPFKDDLLKLIMFRTTTKLQNSLGISIYFYQSSLSQHDIEKWLTDFNYKIDCIRLDELILSANNIFSIIVSSNRNIFFIQNISLKNNNNFIGSSSSIQK